MFGQVTRAPEQTGTGERLPLTVCVGFGVGAVGTSMLLNIVTTFFPVLMSTVLGQSAAVAGALLTLSKLYDILADVVIGHLSDRTRTRIGRRRPYLLAGAVVSAVSFLLLFLPNSRTGEDLVVFMGWSLVLYSTGYALFAIPYLAMAGEMTDGYHQRTRLMSFRVFFAAIGQLIASAGAAWLIDFAGGGARGYAALGAAGAAILLTTMSICFFGTAKARWTETPPKVHVPRFDQLRSLASNRPFMILMGVKVSQFLAIAIVGTTKLLFLLNVLHVGYQGLMQLTFAQNVVFALAVPVWSRIAMRIGKRQAYLAATAMLALLYLSWLFTGPGVTSADIWVRGVVNGIAAAGTSLMSVAMLPDVMEYDRLRTGQKREGVFSAAYTIVEKAAFAIGPGLIGVLLTASGYIATTKGQIVEQPQTAVVMLYAGAAVIPAAMIALSFLLMLGYRLDEKTLAQAAKS